MLNRKINLFVIFVTILCLLTGCLPQAETVNQKTYMLSATIPKIALKKNLSNLQIDDTTIVPAFSSNQFIYRTSNLTYTRDFYNIFFIPVNQQINRIIYKAFRQTKAFANVVTSGSLLATQYILKTTISDLYADYRSKKQPRAILGIDVALYKHTTKGLKIVFEKTYAQQSLLTTQNSYGLVKAWSADLTHILPTMIININNAITIENKKLTTKKTDL